MKKLFITFTPNHRKLIKSNLIHSLRFLTIDDIDYGKQWYIDNNNLIKDIHKEYQFLDVDKTAQLFSVFSSNTKYSRNVDEVYRILKLVKKGIKIDLDKHRKWQSRDNWKKALPLFEGKDIFLARNKAKKTYSFYRNLLLDNNYITIDTHIVKALFKNNDIWKDKLNNKGIYEDLETIMKIVAIPYIEKYDINYYEFQASLWNVMRNDNRYKIIEKDLYKIPYKIYSQEYKKAKKLKCTNMETIA